MGKLLAAFIYLLVCQTTAHAAPAALIPVPPGNRNATIPELPAKVIERLTNAGRTAQRQIYTVPQMMDNNFHTVQSLMTSDLDTKRPLIREIVKAAKIYGVDPVAVLGCITGEHVFNVRTNMDAQDLIARTRNALPYWTNKFESNNIDLAQILTRPEFAKCDPNGSQYAYWICAQDVWSSKLAGQTLEDGTVLPSDSIRTVFFNPIGVGYTYGLGQLDPLRVLMTTDIVSKKSGFPLATLDNASDIYEALLDPYMTIHYVAANVSMIIATYARISGFDISQNPGVIASMYNLGHEWTHARERRDENAQSMKTTGQIAYPEENFYGWYINLRVEDLKKLVQLGGG